MKRGPGGQGKRLRNETPLDTYSRLLSKPLGKKHVFFWLNGNIIGAQAPKK